MSGRFRSHSFSEFESDSDWARPGSWGGRKRADAGGQDTRSQHGQLSPFGSGSSDQFRPIDSPTRGRSASVGANIPPKKAPGKSELSPFRGSMLAAASFSRNALDPAKLAKTLAKDPGTKKLGGESKLAAEITKRMQANHSMQQQWANKLASGGHKAMASMHRDFVNNALSQFGSNKGGKKSK